MNEMQQFLKEEFIPRMRMLQADAKPGWGKMNAQQMAEHMLDFFMVSTGKKQFPLVSPPEHMPKLQAFLRSEKQFRENTKAPETILGEEPTPVRFESLIQALDELEIEVQYFFHLHEQQPGLTAVHPVFGELGFDDWVRLHYKHVTHHLRQFALLS